MESAHITAFIGAASAPVFTSTKALQYSNRIAVKVHATSRKAQAARLYMQADTDDNENPVPKIVVNDTPTNKSALANAWDVIKNGLAVAAVIAALVFTGSDAANAAQSGGRMGGSNFRSAPSMSAPRSSGGYSGGGYGYGGPSIYSPPMFAPFSFGPAIYVSPFGGFGGLGSFLLFSAVAGTVLSAVSRARQTAVLEEEGNPTTSYVCLKVALLATATELKRDLERLAMSADTESMSGLHAVLQDTVLALARNPDYWMYAASETKKNAKMTEVQSAFDSASMRERAKLSEETLSNVDSIKRRRDPARQLNKGVPDEFLLVTLMVAATGEALDKLPKQINGTEDVRNTLLALGSVSKYDLQAVEIIWTPEAYGDTYTRAEMLLDHPELRNI